MKICMYSVACIFNDGSGGIRRFKELLCSLKKAGHDVYLYSNDSTEAITGAGFKGRTLSREQIKSAKMIGLKLSVGNHKLFKEIKDHYFDRVIVFDVPSAFSLVFNGVKNIYLFLRQDMYIYKKIQFDDSGMFKFSSFFLLHALKFVESLCLRRSAKIIVQCKFDLKNLVNRHPVLKKQVLKKSLIQINNVNPSWVVRKDSEKISKVKRYDVCFIGNFKDYRKGHDLFLSAIRQLCDEGNDLRSVVIGDGKHLDKCKKECANYENIDFLGRLNDPALVLASSRLLVVPSYADSCPNTVMEALYFRVPVIGSDRGGIPEILNRANWVFEMNIKSIKDAIIYSLVPENNELLLKEQQERRNELTFDWGSRVLGIIES